MPEMSEQVQTKAWAGAKAMTSPSRKGNGYVIECLQAVRKTVQHTLSLSAKAHLKSQHLLLNPPADALNGENRKRLGTLLGYSSLLSSVWEWKEAFTASHGIVTATKTAFFWNAVSTACCSNRQALILRLSRF
jgi:hypothetical protein